jgi:hypothetical protein
MVGNSHGRHFHIDGSLDQIIQTDGSIQKRVSSMDVEVDKIGRRHGYPLRNMVTRRTLQISRKIRKIFEAQSG